MEGADSYIIMFCHALDFIFLCVSTTQFFSSPNLLTGYRYPYSNTSVVEKTEAIGKGF